MTSETGVFWLPDDPDTKLPGHLGVAENGTPTLELHGEITPSMEVVNHNEGTGVTELRPAEDPSNLVIHGFLENSPRLVTLVDCMTTRRSSVHFTRVPLDQHKLIANVMLRGAHVAGKAATFTGVRVRVGDIDTWAGLRAFGREDPEDGGVTVNVRRANLPPVTTSQGVTLSIKEEIGASWGSLTESRISRSVWLQADSLAALTLQETDRSYASPIASYLSFALGADTPLTAMQVKHEEDWLEVRHSGIQSEPTRSVQRGDVLLPLHAAGLEVLSGFLDVHEKTGPAAPVIANLLPRGRNPNIETQVVELTTVAEGLHRALFPEDVRMSQDDAERLRALVAAAVAQEDGRLQQIVNGSVSRIEEASYKQRLKRLADVTAAAMPGVCGKQNRWVTSVYNARNSFAHRTQGFLEEDLIEEFYAVSQSLRWVLMCIMLLKSGASAETLAARVQQNQQYGLFLQHMRSSLPSVYGE